MKAYMIEGVPVCGCYDIGHQLGLPQSLKVYGVGRDKLHGLQRVVWEMRAASGMLLFTEKEGNGDSGDAFR
jgi:hypothetical protein